MVNCWTLSTEGISDAVEDDLSRSVVSCISSHDPSERGCPINNIGYPPAQRHDDGLHRRRRRLLIKISRRPQENSIGLHSQNVAGFTKHPERCTEWFSHFRQRKLRGALDLILLQETRVGMGELASLQHLYNSTWGFVNKPGYTIWTESEHP